MHEVGGRVCQCSTLGALTKTAVTFTDDCYSIYWDLYANQQISWSTQCFVFEQMYTVFVNLQENNVNKINGHCKDYDMAPVCQQN